MAVLVIADHDGATLRETTAKTVSAALKIGGEVDIVVLGSNAKAVAEAAARITGVRKVLLAESDALGQGIVEAEEAALLPIVGEYDAILSPATSAGKNLIPRLAARLDLAPIGEVVQVIDAKTFVRPIYAGNALETVRTSDAKVLATIRPTVFAAAPEGGSAPVEALDAGAGAPASRFVSQDQVKSGRPELGSAKIVISGAIQHLAGIKDAKVIVAINKDAEAPIFGVADYGLVGDYKTIVPELMAELSKIGR